MKEMQTAGEFALRPVPTYGKTRNVPTALREPDLSQFGADEIALVDKVLKNFDDWNGTEMERVSHRMVGQGYGKVVK